MNAKKQGFTLIELMVTVAMAVIVLLGVGIALVDSQRGWHKMYNRVYGDVTTDSYTVKKVFDNVVRKSSIKRYVLGFNNLTVFYYKDLNSTELDQYANFRKEGIKLLLDYGELDAEGNHLSPSSTMTLARNVVAVDFSVNGVCVQMILKLDDGGEAVTVTCSAIRHN
jgi:prepilin-type N-terminal cleavage/methylation domain-containing protein